MTPLTPRYTARELGRIACLTPRQVQWWDETGALPAVHEGHKRFYSDRDLCFAFLARDFAKRGFGLAGARRVWKEIDRQGHDLLSSTSPWMVTDGAKVKLLAGIVETLAFLTQPRPGWQLLDADDLRRRVAEAPSKVCVRRPIARAEHAAQSAEECARRQA